MTNPLVKADYDLASQMFREAVEEHITTEDNYEDIRATFSDLVDRSYRNGKFIVVIEKLIEDHLWSRMNNRAGSATKSMLRDVHSGQTGMDLTEWRSQVITVGEHRRTTIRNLDANDLVRIIEVRQRNADKANAALLIAEDAVARLLAALGRYPSMDEALDDGALLTESEEFEAAS